MSDPKNTPRVREPVQVYLDGPDLYLLDDLVVSTGLTKAELLRRGLRRLSNDGLADQVAGWSLDRLIGAADGPPAPPYLAANHDEYLYGKASRGRSRPR